MESEVDGHMEARQRVFLQPPASWWGHYQNHLTTSIFSKHTGLCHTLLNKAVMDGPLIMARTYCFNHTKWFTFSSTKKQYIMQVDMISYSSFL